MDDRHQVLMADWNTDGRPDLVVTQKSGTAGDRTALQVLDGSSTFKRFLLRTSTGQDPTDDRHDLSMVDWNEDGRLDLVMVQNRAQRAGVPRRTSSPRSLDPPTRLTSIVS